MFMNYMHWLDSTDKNWPQSWSSRPPLTAARLSYVDETANATPDCLHIRQSLTETYDEQSLLSARNE